MQFLSWGINKADVAEARAALREDHWAFWDGYDGRLIARGPTLDETDPLMPTGSIHIAELDGWNDAKIMTFEEPYAKAGLFKDIILSRFSLELGRTQFEFKALPDRLGYFVYCPAVDDARKGQPGLAAAHQDFCQSYDDMFVCRGALLTEDGKWNGSLFFVEVPTQRDVERFLDDEPYNRAGLFAETQVTRWRRGGRANAPYSKTSAVPTFGADAGR